MEELNIIKNNISRLFIVIGTVGLLISIIDIAYIVFPLQLSNLEWIFTITQNLINSLLAPALCIVLLLTGIYLIEDYASKKEALVYEKIISLISFVFGLLIGLSLLFYSLSIKTYETTVVSSVKTQSQEILKQYEQIYKEQKVQISEKLYNQKVNEVQQKTAAQIKHAKKIILFKSIKIIAETILYIFLFFAVAILSLSSSRNNLLKLRFSNKLS